VPLSWKTVNYWTIKEGWSSLILFVLPKQTIRTLTAPSRCAKTQHGQPDKQVNSEYLSFLAAESPIPAQASVLRGISNNHDKTLKTQGPISPAGMLLIFPERGELTRHWSPDSLSAIFFQDWRIAWGGGRGISLIVADLCVCCILCICNKPEVDGGVVAADLSFNLTFLWGRAALEIKVSSFRSRGS